MPPALLQDSEEGVLLAVHVQPRASRTEAVGVHGDALKIRVAAPPAEGAANEALCRYLAARLNLARHDVRICAGQGARRKRVLLKRVTAGRVAAVFALASPAR